MIHFFAPERSSERMHGNHITTSAWEVDAEGHIMVVPIAKHGQKPRANKHRMRRGCRPFHDQDSMSLNQSFLPADEEKVSSILDRCLAPGLAKGVYQRLMGAETRLAGSSVNAHWGH
eukprot:335977-Amphidinium_carterae.1